MKWLVLIALAACGGKGEDKPAASPCETAIGRGVDMTLEKRMSRGPMAKSPDAKKLMAELAPKLKAALTELCVKDAWADSVVQCFQTAPDIATCKDGLKPEQRAKYTQEMMKVMMGQRGGTGMQGHPPAGSAAPGSAAPAASN